MNKEEYEQLCDALLTLKLKRVRKEYVEHYLETLSKLNKFKITEEQIKQLIDDFYFGGLMQEKLVVVHQKPKQNEEKKENEYFVYFILTSTAEFSERKFENQAIFSFSTKNQIPIVDVEKIAEILLSKVQKYFTKRIDTYEIALYSSKNYFPVRAYVEKSRDLTLEKELKSLLPSFV
jgi:hypothetical protein